MAQGRSSSIVAALLGGRRRRSASAALPGRRPAAGAGAAVVAFTSVPRRTRGGAMERRLLRDVAESRLLGDTTRPGHRATVGELHPRAATEASKEG